MTQQNEHPDGHNRRAFTRIFFDAESVLLQGDQAWSVQLVDISLHGLLVKTEEIDKIDQDAPLTASIHLGGDIQIVMQVTVAHTEDNKLGLACQEMELDSLIHLRRLVELNVGDTSLLERELNTLSA